MTKAKKQINPKVKKTLKIVGDVILYTIFAFSFVMLIFSIFAKKNGQDGFNIFGHQCYTVQTASMEKCDQTDVSNFEIKSLKVNSLIAVKTVPEDKEQAKEFYADIKVGDVLTFKYVYTSQITITHRVVEIEDKGNGYIFILEGDNKAEATAAGQQIIDTRNEDSPNYVIGKVVWNNYALGSIITFFKSPYALIFVIIVPCSLIIVYELGKILVYVMNNKKQKVVQQVNDKDAEIEELKKKLAEAESNKNDNVSSTLKSAVNDNEQQLATIENDAATIKVETENNKNN